MRTGTLLFLLLSLVWTATGNAQNAPETHVITMQVNTGMIDASNADAVSNFGQDSTISNREFTTTVRPGDIVVWQAFSNSAPETDQVLIRSIVHEDGVQVFGAGSLSDNPQNPGVVVATVMGGNDGDVEKYSVRFTVVNNGVPREGMFIVDPKILVKN